MLTTAIETCPVCGGAMPRGHRWRVQLMAERDWYEDVPEVDRPAWHWAMESSTMCCDRCAAAVTALLRRMRDGD